MDLVINDKKIDIKTMLRTCDVNINYMTGNLMASQVNNKASQTEWYLFTSFNTLENKLEVIGLAQKEDIEFISEYISTDTIRYNRAGKPIKIDEPIFEVPYKKLIQISSLNDIEKIID